MAAKAPLVLEAGATSRPRVPAGASPAAFAGLSQRAPRLVAFGPVPSAALQTWKSTAKGALDEIAAAHAAVGGQGPGRRYATQEINHAYAVLLSSQFQRFCRDLHTEAAAHVRFFSTDTEDPVETEVPIDEVVVVGSAASALSQTKAPAKITSQAAASAASEVLSNQKSSAKAKSAAASALAQRESRKREEPAGRAMGTAQRTDNYCRRGWGAMSRNDARRFPFCACCLRLPSPTNQITEHHRQGRATHATDVVFICNECHVAL